MTIKRILAMYAGVSTDEAMMKCANLVARGFHAHIAAVFPRGAADFPDLYDVLPVDEAQMLNERMSAQLRRREEETFEALEAFMKREGIDHVAAPQATTGVSVRWEAVAGRGRDFVARRGGAYDLIVIGRPVNDPETGRLRNTETIESALFSTGRPVLVAPPDPPVTLGETVLIGWNRSAQAARAFHAAKALLLERARKVRILSVTTGAKDGPTASDIAENLAWHGIPSEIRELSPDHRSIGSVLLAEADVIKADLIVMGAYTQSRLRQMLLGGVTSDVLASATIPLFMAH